MRPFLRYGLLDSAVFIPIALFALWLAWPIFTTETAVQAAPAVFQGTTFEGASQFIILFLGVTVFMLGLIHFGLQRVIEGILIVGTFFLSAYALWFTIARFLGEVTMEGLAGACILSAGIIAWGFLRKDMRAINLAGGLAVGWAAASLGASLHPLVAVFILDLLAVYDAIAVYGTKHMLTLAKGLLVGGMPIGMMVFGNPEGKPLDINTPRTERTWLILGWGDLMLPAMFVVSTNLFRMPRIGGLTFMTIGAIAGAVAGYFLLGLIAERWPLKGHAGLPPIVGCMTFAASCGWVLGLIIH